MMKIKMPLRIAKFGLCMLNQNELLIMGGLLMEANVDQDHQPAGEAPAEPSYSQITSIFKFDIRQFSWTQLTQNLIQQRILYSNLPKINGNIYAIGGTMNSSTEYCPLSKLNDDSPQWKEIQRCYPGGFESDDLQSFAFCFIEKPQ